MYYLTVFEGFWIDFGMVMRTHCGQCKKTFANLAVFPTRKSAIFFISDQAERRRGDPGCEH